MQQFKKKLRQFIDAVNSWYGFSLIAYAAVVYLYSHTVLLISLLLLGIPIFTGWGGYIFRGYWQARTQRYGFRILSDDVSYEIGPNKTYTFSYNTQVKACVDHLMVYPVGYRWSGEGEETMPQVTGAGQHLLAMIQNPKHKKGKKADLAKLLPYQTTISADGDWRYSFIVLNPPIHKDQTVNIEYSQGFVDTKNKARPRLNYFVRMPLDEVTLNIKFPDGVEPKKLTSSYIKPADPSKPLEREGVVFDKTKHWATWHITDPKPGYCYRIDWEI